MKQGPIHPRNYATGYQNGRFAKGVVGAVLGWDDELEDMKGCQKIYNTAIVRQTLYCKEHKIPHGNLGSRWFALLWLLRMHAESFDVATQAMDSIMVQLVDGFNKTRLKTNTMVFWNNMTANMGDVVVIPGKTNRDAWIDIGNSVWNALEVSRLPFLVLQFVTMPLTQPPKKIRTTWS